MPATEATQVRPLLEATAALVASLLPEILAMRFNITMKADGSPVTDADVFLEKHIHDFLNQRIPGLTFVGEETYAGGAIPTSGMIALLDPVDGTENFCSGLKEWGVSFGLWKDRQHLGSLLMMPELGDQLMTGDRPPRLRSRIVGFSSSFCEPIAEQMREVQESRIFGCAVYNLMNVARGAYARFSNPRGAYAWDLLPGLMLALEQGCSVMVEGREFRGEFLEPHRRYRVDVHHRHDLHPG